MTTKDIATLAIALLGAGLGVYNTLQGRKAQRVRVELDPGWTEPAGNGGHEAIFEIEVVNHSAFAVTVNEVGFLSRGGGHPLLVPKHAYQGEALPPCLIGPRYSATFRFWPYRAFPMNAPLSDAYVRLATGERLTGTNKATRDLCNDFGRV